MKAYITYTILDTIKIENYKGTKEEFKEAIYVDTQNIANEIFNAVGLCPNDIEIEVVED